MGNSSSPYSTLILIALMVLAFYFLILRPNKKRQQAQQQTLSSLVPGTRVLLTSGVFGTLLEVGAKQAVIEISPGVQLTVLKQAIARPVRDGDEDSVVDDEPFDDSVDEGVDSSNYRDEERSGLTDVDSATSDRPSSGSVSFERTEPQPGTNTAATPTKD